VGRSTTRTLLLAVAALLTSTTAHAYTTFESWECCATALGSYGTGDPPIIVEPVVPGALEPVDGSQVLSLIDNSPSGTPYVYVAWVVGLHPGDTVEASIWRYDDSPGESPSCRIWGHWNDDPVDVDAYDGSAGGNEDYGPGTGWDETSWTWYVPEEHTGLVIQVRTYSSPGDQVWVDALSVTVPNHAFVWTPTFMSPVGASTWSSIKALYR